MWHAEEANSVRIAARSNLVLSGILAIAGLKLFVSTKEITTIIQHGGFWWSHIFFLFSASAFVGLLYALRIVLEVERRRNADSASSSMMQTELEQLLDAPPDYVNEEMLVTVQQAAIDLYARNQSRAAAVSRAQMAFFFSTILLFVSLIIYTGVAVDSARREGLNTHECNKAADEQAQEAV